MAISTIDLHRFTVDEYERMAEFGVLPESGVELVDGLVVEMSPKCDRHGYAVNLLNESFVDQRRGRYIVNPESLTLRLGLRDAREPDVVLARLTRSYARERPRPEDIALIVEVADSSLAYDLGEKKIAYARGGIPEYWVVDIPHETVHVFRGANRFAEGYLHESVHNAEQTIAPSEYPDVAVAIARILGVDAEREGPASA